jgi:hypothetical protein
MKPFITCSIKTIPLLLILIFSACGSNNQEENSTPVADTTEITTPKVSASTTEDFFYSLPSPLLMAKIFKKTGLKYMDGVTNAPENISKYSSSQSKTLNLGIYSTDLAYSVLNKQSQMAIQYMESVKRLSDDLGMSSVFATDDYLQRFKDNLNNEDSLINVVCALKGEMDVFMRDNDKEKQTILIFIGAWLENMYIATQLTRDANKEKVALRVAEQKYVLNGLMNVCTNFQGEDMEFKALYVKLNELKNLFDNLTVHGIEEKITIDERQLKAITEKTHDLRKEIVE